MNVLLYQLDGALPNIALMRIAAHHNQLGDKVTLHRTGHPQPELFDALPDRVYASLIFEKSRPAAESLLTYYPNAIVGGTGWNMAHTLEAHGITTAAMDYSLYPKFTSSIGFTQRGCRLKCSFCVVPKKEGAVREEQTVHELWRGDPYPRHLLLLDNDFFGQPNWRARIAEMRDGNFRVSFSQGINARMITDEAAEALASVDYRDDSMKTKRIYTAWDNRKDEERLFAGLNRLTHHGIKPDHIMVYMLVGYWNGPQLHPDDFHRQKRLREFGCRPYPMPYVRTPELIGFQRWIIGAYDKQISWEHWAQANYRPENLKLAQESIEL